ncbi:TetR family transcriptional regulator [Allonocardiopsis opalescens]|uniref:TetR family transcriptional regulator n=1 Tax=Allonocardiopsis opalescens TaxID=1144618 RepID=A0A2T0Q081_9ACTN|nr:TetR family transcriptional regulator [Allonocardiopsis opalescens]PRX97115.1 TetR family transcriptional regulator [Allonocardiopsis opalescens]
MTTISADAPLGRRERKKQATRQALAAAALRLAAERGVDGVTVEEIATAADLSPRTFFNHFSCKEEAIADPGDDRVERVRAVLSTRPAGEAPLEALRHAMGSIRDNMTEAAIREWRERHRLVRENPALKAYHLASFARFERAIIEEMAARSGTDPDSDVYPRMLARAGLTAVRTAFELWRDGEGPDEFGALIDTAFDQIASGFTLPPPR